MRVVHNLLHPQLERRSQFFGSGLQAWVPVTLVPTMLRRAVLLAVTLSCILAEAQQLVEGEGAHRCCFLRQRSWLHAATLLCIAVGPRLMTLMLMRFI